MADYIYLLENRLSAAQRNALRIARDVARARGLTIFLVGGAVRDLTSGSPVRDLDVVVQGSALKLKRELEKAGAVITGENDSLQALYLRLPGHVRMEFGSTVSVTFPRPGKPAVKAATILDDLRRRDFTANAMALSLNEGSYGLLMDPLNGIADIENRHLRLVSNYGFIEDPVRMIKAARLMARLGWEMDERTRSRYETGREEGYLSVLSEFHRGYELEEIVHEEDPLRVMRGLEAEGWMKQLSPIWSSAKANTGELERLREVQTRLEMQNIHSDGGAANFPLLTARLNAQEVAALKASFPRPGFVQEIEALEAEAKQFGAQLASKAAALPSQAWRLITSAPAEAVLWTAFSNKTAAVQAKLKAFATDWPLARQKMPYTQMQEMRITADVPGYDDLLEKLFFELMDGKLQTAEEMKAFLEPYSPPAPPPVVNLRRARAGKKEPRPRASKAKAKPEVEQQAASGDNEPVEQTSGVQPANRVPAPPAQQSPAQQAQAGSPAGAAGKVAAKAPAAAKAATPESAVAVKTAAAQAPPQAAAKAPASRPAAAVAAGAAAPSSAPKGTPSAASKSVPAKIAAALPPRASAAGGKQTPAAGSAGRSPARTAAASAPAAPGSNVGRSGTSAKSGTPVKSATSAQTGKPAARASGAKSAATKNAPSKAASSKAGAGGTAAKAAAAQGASMKKAASKVPARKSPAKAVKAPAKTPGKAPVKATGKAPVKAAGKKPAAGNVRTAPARVAAKSPRSAAKQAPAKAARKSSTTIKTAAKSARRR